MNILHPHVYSVRIVPTSLLKILYYTNNTYTHAYFFFTIASSPTINTHQTHPSSIYTHTTIEKNMHLHISVKKNCMQYTIRVYDAIPLYAKVKKNFPTSCMCIHFLFPAHIFIFSERFSLYTFAPTYIVRRRSFLLSFFCLRYDDFYVFSIICSAFI